jgi:4-amino-4-deoxy-L-arabinose transferase-like glycosyltransferase
VLWAMPQWLLLGRQAITDMALGASLCAAIGFLLLAIGTQERAPVTQRDIRLGPVTLPISSALSLAFLLMIMLLPQALYLVSRNLDLSHGFRADLVIEGSTGTCGILPSHPPCVSHASALRWATPLLQGTTLLACAVFLLHSIAQLQSQRAVYFLAACCAAAVAGMAKGPMALLVPSACLCVVAFVMKKPRWVLSQEFTLGALCIALLMLPWYGATFARHGRLFYDELVMRHMLGRTLTHLHDTTEGDDTSVRYYVHQLGFALFPVVALLPGALVHAFRARSPAQAACPSRTALLVWALSVFTLVAAMGTKFHHYIFPAVPPLAMLVGDYLGARVSKVHRAELLSYALGAAVALRVAHDLATTHDGIVGASRIFSLVCYRYDRPWPEALKHEAILTALSLASIVFAGATVLFKRRAPMLGISLNAAMLLVFSMYTAHVYMPAVSEHRGQRELFEAVKKEDPDATPIAYQLNWKGENFYSGNQIAIFISSGAAFQAWLKQQHVTRYVITEPSRVSSLQAELPRNAQLSRMRSDEQNNAVTVLRVQGL